MTDLGIDVLQRLLNPDWFDISSFNAKFVPTFTCNITTYYQFKEYLIWGKIICKYDMTHY